MQYRIIYKAHEQETTETIIVSSTRAVFALVDYAARWGDEIVSIEERESRTRTWKMWQSVNV